MRVLENALVRLLKRQPFYGHFLLACERRSVSDGPAAGATLHHGTPVLQINPQAFAAREVREQEALLEHILKHLLHLHPLRRGEEHARTWDAACDLAINPTIENLPPGALLPDHFGLEGGLAAEEYCRALARPLDTGNLEGEGVGNATQDSGGDEGQTRQENSGEERTPTEPAPLDNHAIWREADSTPAALAEEVVRDLVREARLKSCGEIPGEVRPLVEGLLAPSPIPWRQVLRQFVATAGRTGRRSTWRRGHRRFDHVTPGVRKGRRLDLLVGVDVSDSTDCRELRESFAAELVEIARARDSRITVLYAGSRIQRIETLNGRSVAAEVFHGGGFTDLRPVFEYARGMTRPPKAIIYLTDGYGESPQEMQFPTLWVLTAEGRRPAPWGVELRLGGAAPNRGFVPQLPNR